MTQPGDELVRVRRDKLDRLRDRGIDPYPHKYTRTHTSAEATSYLESKETNANENVRTEPVRIAGRIMAMRRMGKAIFLDLKDADGQMQVLFRKNKVPEEFDLLDDIDIGDWLGVEGPVMRTRTGEPTVEVHGSQILSKSLRSLPEKWHGLADVETRYRQRYLDLISNDEARSIAVTRSKTIRALRNFMDRSGYIEVETPVLVPIAAGGTATPFKTYYRSLGRDLYLRIATELYLKRLVVGGLEKVYEVGRIFRNEGVDATHNPEFTMMESYEAFADYNDVMIMVEQMVYSLAVEVQGKSTVQFEGREIDLTPPWPRLDLREEIKRESGIDFLDANNINSLKEQMNAIGMDIGHQLSWGGLLDKLLSDVVEPKLVQPSFLVDYPIEMSPLAKRKRDNPQVVERFEGFIAGMEICNSFTELNDPVDQRARFEQQEILREQFQDEELDRLDEDFLVAVEHGMPPTGGLGLGIDRIIMLLTGKTSIREVVLFPQLRSS